MQEKPDWRSADVADYYAKHDFPDFAQEFLQRNQTYREEYRAAKENSASNIAIHKRNMEVLARRWGMIFPLRSKSGLQVGSSTLGAWAVIDMRILASCINGTFRCSLPLDRFAPTAIRIYQRN